MKDESRIFIRDLRLPARIGAFDDERGRTQPIRIDVEATLAEGLAPPQGLGDVVCYKGMVEKIEAILAGGHIDLLETLGGHIADALLADARIAHIRLRIEKTEAIAEAAAAGVEIARSRDAP